MTVPDASRTMARAPARRPHARGILPLVVLLAAPLLAGCAAELPLGDDVDAGGPANRGTVHVRTAYDPNLTRPEDREHGPPTNAPAADGRMNVYLVYAQDWDDWREMVASGLWDPAAPPDGEPGETVEATDNVTARTFPLDDDGRVTFSVRSDQDVMVALFRPWGTAPGTSCPDGASYDSRGPDADQHVDVALSERVVATVAFGIACA